MSTTYITPLENIVKSYLKTHNRKALPKVFVNKAVLLINDKINGKCCTTSAPTILFPTRLDNALTRVIENLLFDLIKKGNVASLKRTKALLLKNTGIPCC